MASLVPEIPVLARDQAFETLYRRYVKDVYHYALALLRNPADAEDVTQTTFMNAYSAWKRGQEIHKPHNWLIKIAHNVARTRYAHANRRVKEVPLEDHVDQLAVPEEEKPNVEAVLRALGRLPFNQRAAIVMRELEGRSYAEISDTIGVSVPAVETLIFRARRSLRLRASALRTLGAVPLPNSLAQLFGGGGGAAAVAGGGGFLGTSLLLKAALMLVVGAAATGIARDQIVGATAASKPAAPIAIAPPWGLTAAAARPLRGLRVQTIQSVDGKSLVEMPGLGVAASNRMSGEELSGTTQPGSPGALVVSFASSVVTTLSTPPSAQQVTAPVATLITTVQQTAAAAPPALPVSAPTLTVGVPTLPVAAPTLSVSVPTLPVSVPTLPVSAPTLPVSAPTLPVAAPSVPVSAPSLPPAPVKLPPLPPSPAE